MGDKNNACYCRFCGNTIPLPEQIDDGFPFNGVIAFVLGTNHLDVPQIMMVVLCLSCGTINDIFYDFREIICDDYVTKEPPWKDDEGYKESMQIQEMVHFILFNREVTERGLK